MRIGILTIQSNNYGNRLQNHALQEVLMRLGHEPYTLRRKGSPLAIAKGAVRRVVKRDGITAMARFSSTHIRYARRIVSPNYVSPHLVRDFDRFVIGSDQLWNPTFSFNSELDYLPFLPPEPKVAYAASFGISRIDENRDYTAWLLNGIPQISMREDAGAAIVRDLTGRNVPVVLDPTLLLGPDEWAKVAKPPKDAPSGQFLFKYFLGEDVHADGIDAFAEDRGLEVYALNRVSRPIGPSEFVWLASNAAMVCTDSFHGSVFAILHHVPFVIFERQSADEDMSSRFDTLCSELGLEAHRFASPRFSIDAVLATHWVGVEARLRDRRGASIGWLADAIG